MPTVEENRSYWSIYDWTNEGREWTQGFGGPDILWYGIVYPRIRHLLPSAHILELAPGYGLWTEFLRPHCDKMTLVDLTPNCIEHCKKRFGQDGYGKSGLGAKKAMTYHVNDGRSLDMLEPDSIDFCFSLHSLVHANADVMDSYVKGLARALKPGGVAFIHHSNLAPHMDEFKHLETPAPEEHWRGRDMSADSMRASIEDAGLRVQVQEVIPWGSDRLIDAYTMFGKVPAREVAGSTEPVVFKNPDFWPRAFKLKATAEIYAGERR